MTDKTPQPDAELEEIIEECYEQGILMGGQKGGEEPAVVTKAVARSQLIKWADRRTIAVLESILNWENEPQANGFTIVKEQLAALRSKDKVDE